MKKTKSCTIKDHKTFVTNYNLHSDLQDDICRCEVFFTCICSCELGLFKKKRKSLVDLHFSERACYYVLITYACTCS